MNEKSLGQKEASGVGGHKAESREADAEVHEGR